MCDWGCATHQARLHCCCGCAEPTAAAAGGARGGSTRTQLLLQPALGSTGPHCCVHVVVRCLGLAQLGLMHLPWDLKALRAACPDFCSAAGCSAQNLHLTQREITGNGIQIESICRCSEKSEEVPTVSPSTLLLCRL